MIQYENKYRVSAEKFSVKTLLNAVLLSNSSKSENSRKLFNLKDLLIQPTDCEEGFRTDNKT